jgi:hypothetical protein
MFTMKQKNQTRILSILLALCLLTGLPTVTASAAATPEKEVRLYFVMPSGMQFIPFAGLPDLTGLTLVLTDDLGFTKQFHLPDQSDLRHYAFSDSEGTGSMDVSASFRKLGGGGNVWVHDYTITVQYETKKEVYFSRQTSPYVNDFTGWSMWNEPFLELTQGQTQEVIISHKQEAKGFAFTADESGWYSFNITGDTTGSPYISVSRTDPHGDEQYIYKLDFNCSYAHSVSLLLGANETVHVAAATLGGCFTGSFDITAAPAVLSVPEETIKTRYHGIIPWSKILKNTTYEPRDLNIALSDGGVGSIVGDGWIASQRGEFTVTLIAPSVPSQTAEEASFNVKVEYDVLQWFCFIFLGGFIWLKWTGYSM